MLYTPFNLFVVGSDTDDRDNNEVASVSHQSASHTTAGRRTLRRRLAEVVPRMRQLLTSCTADTSDVHVPLNVSLLLLAGYVLLGALLFGLWEPDWGVLVGSYFCFVTLSTIGFGDVVPGTSLDAWSSTSKLVLCSLYVVCGLALLAMCFDLMQDQVRQVCRVLPRIIRLTWRHLDLSGVPLRYQVRQVCRVVTIDIGLYIRLPETY